MKNKEDYEGFVKHTMEWDKYGIPYGLSDLKLLARKYNTPIPKTILICQKRD